MKLPKGVIIIPMESPDAVPLIHDALEEIFNEPTYPRRNVRKDPRPSDKTPGGDSNDGPSSKRK